MSVPLPPVERVGASAAVERVVAGTTVDVIVAGVAGERIVVADAEEVLEIGEDVAGASPPLCAPALLMATVTPA